MTGVHLKRIDPARDAALAERLLVVQRLAYQVEAGLIGDDRIPALHESIADVMAAPLAWTGAFYEDGELVGAVAVTSGGGMTDIDRLVVHPAAHRRGVGWALLQHVLRSRDPNHRVTVSTGRENAPARALYRRAGFVDLEPLEVVPGLWVVPMECPDQ